MQYVRKSVAWMTPCLKPETTTIAKDTELGRSFTTGQRARQGNGPKENLTAVVKVRGLGPASPCFGTDPSLCCDLSIYCLLSVFSTNVMDDEAIDV